MTDEQAADPWLGDLFSRHEEAELLTGYVESVYGRETQREDAKAHTIAVDAGYGEGKTFFLKRLAKVLAKSHPVAFVDAWADDLADEPLTALIATLQNALDPLISQSSTIKSKWDDVLQRTGKVAKIVATALAKRSLSVALGAGALAAAEEAMAGVGESAASALKDGLKDAANSSVDGAISTLTSVSPNKLMRERVEAFEAGRAAIDDLKRSLSALVDALLDEKLAPPIVVIVDELDRCRPPYAIKLLEEVKHLFDVPGLVFIFGMHTDQLALSVAGAYGPEFDGKGYLRRFLNRQYRLKQPDLEPLLTKLLSATQISGSMYYPPLRGPNVPDNSSLAFVMAKYMRAYDLKARDAFEVIDILQTTVALTKGQRLHLPYLLPLIFGYLKGMPPGALPQPSNRVEWHLLVPVGRAGRAETNPAHLAEEYRVAAELSDDDLQVAVSDFDSLSLARRAVADNRSMYAYDQPIWAIENYPKLISTIARFTNPQIVAAVGQA